MAQDGQEATFHIDHVHPRRLGGATTFHNLALACVSCSLRKGAAVEAVHPETGTTVLLFDPRKEAWTNHFDIDAEARRRTNTIGASDHLAPRPEQFTG